MAIDFQDLIFRKWPYFRLTGVQPSSVKSPAPFPNGVTAHF